MGSVIGKKGESSRICRTSSKLEVKMAEAMKKRAQAGTTLKSFDNIILKFYTIDRSIRNCKSVFKQFDQDSNGSIDPEELKRCLQHLGIAMTEEEIEDLFVSCEIMEGMGMKFNEFIVLLCLVYLLQKPTPSQTKSVMGLAELEVAFEALVDAFVFLDKNKDGSVSKNEMIEAMSDTKSTGPSSRALALKRFEEMDCDRNGKVSFKEFVFAFTHWVGLESIEGIERDKKDKE
ncbi:calcium-binding EF-hand family protein [Wolffia australiana]